LNIQCVISGFPFYRLSVNVRRLVASQIIACTNPDCQLLSPRLMPRSSSQWFRTRSQLLRLPLCVSCALYPVWKPFNRLPAKRTEALIENQCWLPQPQQPVSPSFRSNPADIHPRTYIIYCDQIINSNARGAVACLTDCHLPKVPSPHTFPHVLQNRQTPIPANH